jgi:hypothetical protein
MAEIQQCPQCNILWASCTDPNRRGKTRKVRDPKTHHWKDKTDPKIEYRCENCGYKIKDNEKVKV